MILFCGFNGFSEKIIATMMVIHFWGLFLFDFLGPLNIWMISNKSFRVDCVLFVTFSCATLLLKYSHTNLVKKHCNRVYTHTSRTAMYSAYGLMNMRAGMAFEWIRMVKMRCASNFCIVVRIFLSFFSHSLRVGQLCFIKPYRIFWLCAQFYRFFVGLVIVYV